MNAQNESGKERLLELLSDRALFGISPEEEAELAALQREHPDVDDQEMDRIVALLESSNHVDKAMPADVHAQILRASSELPSNEGRAKRNIDGIGATTSTSTRRDWMIAAIASAATLLLAALAFWRPQPEAVSMQEQRERLLADASDAVRVDWSPTDETQAYSGDVVWSGEKQRGYMTFRGLPVNDRNKEQYQLWIFDAEQDDKFPIDGGVFDVTSDSVVVEIDAKLPVVSPSMFAITIEKPGGVVVSDRSRLPLLAKLP